MSSLHCNRWPRLKKTQRAFRYFYLRRHFYICGYIALGGEIWKLEWHELWNWSHNLSRCVYFSLRPCRSSCGESQASHYGDPGSIQVQNRRDLLWTKRH
jgi:hypothetical protein